MVCLWPVPLMDVKRSADCQLQCFSFLHCCIKVLTLYTTKLKIGHVFISHLLACEKYKIKYKLAYWISCYHDYFARWLWVLTIISVVLCVLRCSQNEETCRVAPSGHIVQAYMTGRFTCATSMCHGKSDWWLLWVGWRVTFHSYAVSTHW